MKEKAKLHNESRDVNAKAKKVRLEVRTIMHQIDSLVSTERARVLRTTDDTLLREARERRDLIEARLFKVVHSA